MRTPDAAHAERLAAFGAVSTQLSLLGDRRLGEVVAAAEPLGSGIGGRSARLTVAGRRVFVKRVPLTDVERRPEHVRSTANVFGLPVFYQYGVGSAGFGAWRELAAHIMTTGWVLSDAHFANVLTDGRRLYFADLGLALSSAFELAPDESDFLADHTDYDRCYAAAHLLRHHLPTGVRAGTDHEAFLRDWVEGRRPDGVPGAVGAITERHARTSLVLDGFHRRLFTDGKHTPYPRADIERALRAAAGDGAGSPGRAR